jgi:hypothetical protein
MEGCPRRARPYRNGSGDLDQLGEITRGLWPRRQCYFWRKHMPGSDSPKDKESPGQTAAAKSVSQELEDTPIHDG